MIVAELFSGAGGASLGIDRAGADPVVGFEWDADAARTHRAAGHLTIRCDVSAYPTAPLRGKVSGLWASPPCPQYSAAGSGAGNLIHDVLASGIANLLGGFDTRGEVAMEAWGPIYSFTDQENDARDKPRPSQWVWDKTAARVAEAVLVLEPARWVFDLRPAWVACEQVPAVLPLWQAMAQGLTALGYGCWAGILDSANFGVPQNRKRAILMAKRGARVGPPPPTHSDHRASPDLFLKPWQSMADALGWGLTAEPCTTVTAGGTATGGAEPIARGGREKFERERTGGGHGVTVDQRHGTAPTFDATAQPSRSVVRTAKDWHRDA